MEYSKIKFYAIGRLQESLEDALKNLFEVNRKIYDSIIPIAMIGELSEWIRSVPIGETHYFDFELFKD